MMDNKRQIELIVAPIVVIIAIILVISTFKKVSDPQKHEAVNVPESESLPVGLQINSEKFTAEKVSVDKLRDNPAQDKNKEYDVGNMSWGRDPFVLEKASLFSPGMNQDKAAKMEQLTKLKLTGMIISDEDSKESIAVINGENLKIGDVVSGFILKEIRQNSVILEWGNEDFELKLWEEEAVKKQEPAKQQQ